MTSKLGKAARTRAKETPVQRAVAHSASAAMETRKPTIVSGGKDLTTTPTKKKEPPQRTESANNWPHSEPDIARCGLGDICASRRDGLPGRSEACPPEYADERSKAFGR